MRFVDCFARATSRLYHAAPVQRSLAAAAAMWLFSAVPGQATDLQPDIRADRVIFVGGRNLLYQPKLTRTGPRADDASFVEERTILSTGWRRLLMVKTSQLREGDAKEISVYDYAGNLLSSPRATIGEIVILEKKRRLFVAQRSAHYLVSESLILDIDGHLVRTILQPENVVSFGNSEDQELVWIVSNAIKAGQPVGRVDVFSVNGDRVEIVEFIAAGTVIVTFKGRTYDISVREPRIPG